MSDITTNTGVLTSLASQQGGVDIVLDHITKQYPGQSTPAVEDFSMRIEPGELVMFVGPSGCGKTTTMKMINRIIEPSSGSIRINGDDVLSLDGNELRRHIGYVIQQIGLFPHFTIAENIAVVPKLLGWSKARTAARVEELLDTVQLDPGTFADRYPRQLSGGQQQRVGVARALAADPPVMLMDEPFGATDPITREKLQAEFLRLQADIGKTIIFVTHDFEEAIRMGDRHRGAERAQPDRAVRHPGARPREPGPRVRALVHRRRGGTEAARAHPRERRARGRTGLPRPPWRPSTSRPRCARRSTSWSSPAPRAST